MDALTAALEQELAARLSAVLQISKELKADFLGLSSLLPAELVGPSEADFAQRLPTFTLEISVSARLVSVGEETDPNKFLNCVEAARAEGDSVGGVIECTVTGCPAGLGGPMFDGMENRIARAIFGIPGVKGIEFGSGFAGAHRRGSENNDPYCIENGAVRTRTNNAGGILGGLSSGMPIVFRAALKPTPSIAKPQDSVDLRTMTETTLSVRGRHDPCIALRAVPCVEAAAAAAIYDAILEEQ